MVVSEGLSVSVAKQAGMVGGAPVLDRLGCPMPHHGDPALAMG